MELKVSGHQLAIPSHTWLCLIGRGVIHRHVKISDRLSSQLIKQLPFGFGGIRAVVQPASRRPDLGKLPIVSFGNFSSSVS